MTPRALTIAGSDPTGGAGIQQDLKVFAAFGVWGLSALTAITVQDTSTVPRWDAQQPDLVRAQIETAVKDIGCDAAKTGMLATPENAETVARALTDLAVPNVVVDPVLTAGSGDSLSDEGFIEGVRDLLLPVATLITPNVPEAAALSGLEVTNRDEQEEAAVALAAFGPDAVLVTGGHLNGSSVVDVLFVDGEIHELKAERIEIEGIHGTGCALSAAITASLAKGSSVVEAVHSAHTVVHDAIARALALGSGARLLDVRG